MPGSKISSLPAAALPLTGSEKLPGVQSGANVRITPDDIAAHVVAGAHSWPEPQTFAVAPVFEDAAGVRAALDLQVGIDLQAHSAALDGFALKTAPVGAVVGTSDAQTLTNKAFTAPDIDGGTADGLTSLGIRSTGGGAFDVNFANTETLTANRTLTLKLNNANRTLDLGGGLTLAGSFTTAGAFACTLTLTAATNITLPNTGIVPNTNTVLQTPRALYRVSPARTLKLANALGQVKSGVGNARLLVIGDSLSGAWGSGNNVSGGGNNSDGARPKAWPAVLASLLTSAGYNALEQGVFGCGGHATMAVLTAYDTRISAGTGWQVGPVNTAGGRLIQCTNTGTGTLSITFSGGDRIKFGYCQGSGNGAFDYWGDSGSHISVDSNNATSAVVEVTITFGSVGTHTVNFARTSGGNVYLAYARGYSSAGCVEVMNAAWGGSKASDWNVASQPWDPKNMISKFNPHLTVFMLGTNEGLNGVSSATWSTNMQALITEAKLYGDVWLLSTPPADPSGAFSAAAQASFYAAAYALADANDIPMLDTTLALGSYALQNAMGAMDGPVHFKAPAYADLGRRMASALLNI